MRPLAFLTPRWRLSSSGTWSPELPVCALQLEEYLWSSGKADAQKKTALVGAFATFGQGRF